jgi:ribonuclease P protein component
LGSCHSFAAPEEGSEVAGGQPSVEARGLLTSSERFSRANRLAKSSDIRRLLNTGRRMRTGHLEFLWSDNVAGLPRMGLIVPKYQSTGVARNRLRRRLKELWRREVQGRTPPVDVLVRARREAYAATFAALRSEVHAWRDAVAGSPDAAP